MSRQQRSRWLCGIRRCFRPRWANGFGVRRRNRFFSPRSYTRRAKEKTAVKPVTGTVMLLMNDHGEEDPVRDGVMPVVSQGLSHYGIEHRYVNLSRLLEEPERLSEFRAIVFCNDLQGFQLPEKFPGVQVFGWDPRGEALDRITANDDEIVSLAVGRLCRAGVTRAAVVWQRNMVQIPDHPRISLFLSRMKAFGIQAEPMPSALNSAREKARRKHGGGQSAAFRAGTLQRWANDGSIYHNTGKMKMASSAFLVGDSFALSMNCGMANWRPKRNGSEQNALFLRHSGRVCRRAFHSAGGAVRSVEEPRPPRQRCRSFQTR